jgi:large repetitive protein
VGRTLLRQRKTLHFFSVRSSLGDPMVNSRKPVLGSMKSQSSKKAKSRKLAKRTRQFETLERRELMAMDFSPQVTSILAASLFRNQEQYDRAGIALTAKLGGSSGTASGESSLSGEGNAPFNTTEAEPNNVRATANFLPLGNGSGQNAAVNVSGQMANKFDEDFYAFDLKKGDIFDARIQASGTVPGAILYNSIGTELLYTKGLFLPTSGGVATTKSPRFTTGSTTLTYIIDTDGRYFFRVGDATGAYTANLRTYRNTLEQEPVGTQQVLFLDFDGALFRNDLLNLDAPTATPPVPAQTVRVPAFSTYASQLGITQAQVPGVIERITRNVEGKMKTILAADTNNGFYPATGNPGDFSIKVVSSNDGDFWGQPNVSRVMIGGTQPVLAPAIPGLLGIAQRVDIGNFDREDTALVMVDTLIADATNLDVTKGGVPRSGTVSNIDLFIELASVVIAHEAGHTLGAIHQDPTNSVYGIIDQFYDPLITSGAGLDGIFGSADDKPLKFLNDDYSPTAGAIFGGGIDNSGQALAFSMPTGKAGSSIIGTAYNDLNRNAVKDTGDAGISGWEVFADVNSNGTRDEGEPRTTTDSAGNYNLRVAPGTYTVRIARPAPWIASKSSEEFKTVTVSSATVSANFGSVIPADTATGFKWLDLNGDGIRDPGEPPLAGVYVYLDLDGDERPDIGEPASLTKADGSYNLTPPGPGTYTIREVVAPGYVQTFPAAGKHTVVYDGRNPLRGYDFGNNESSDWGDAPAPYPTTRAQNGASNGNTPGLRLGVNFDTEQDGRPSTNADGDDTAGSLDSSGKVINDEDGVSLLTPIVRGDGSNIIRVSVTNTTGSPAYLQGWIDFNGNGNWTDPGEQIATNVVFATSGASNITFTAPSNAVGSTFARFRISQDKNLLSTGRSTTGEVEDYAYKIVDGPRVLLQPDTFTVARNSQNNVLDVLANDFKLPNETFTLSTVSSGSQGGRVTIDQASQTVRYTPKLSFTGRDTFTYTAVTPSGLRETTTVTVNVALQFIDPVAVDDSFDVPTNSIGFPLSVLANDVEGRGGALIVQSVTTPDKGGSVVIGSGSQSIRYTPRRDFGGTEQFSYTAVDGTGKVSTANITVHTLQGDRLDDEVEFSFGFLNSANEPITAVRQGDVFKVVVYVDDLRPEKAALEVPPRNITDPGVYSAYLDLLYSSGLVTPNAPTSGTLDFAASFQAPYQTGRSGTAVTPGIIDELGAFVGQVTSFNQPNKLPLVVLDFTATSAGIAEFVGDPADKLPGSEVTFYNAPAAARVANEQIRFGRSTLEIVPNGVNFPFAVDDTRFNVPQGNPFNVDVLTNDVTGNQPPIRITSVTQPGSGQTQINDNGTPNNFADDTITYIPNTNFIGLDQFQYTITDVRGFISTATVTMHVGADTADDVVKLRLSATDLAGVPIDQITVGQQFQLRGYVEDLRTSASQFGVFAAFQDILYSSNLVSVNTSTLATDPGFRVDYAPGYSNAKSGDIRIPGLINEIGSAQTSNLPTGLGEKLQFTITLTARNTGTATFIGDPADIKPFHDSFVFDPTTPLLPSQIRYLSDTLLIVSTAGGSGSSGGEGNTNLTNAFDVNNDGFVSPIDVLILVNSLNTGGSGLLAAGSSAGSGEGGSGKYFLDVNQDNYLSPLDALMVINELNSRQNGGSGEGEAATKAAAPLATPFKPQLVEVPFATQRSTVAPAFVYGPLPTTKEVEEAFSLDEYLAQQSASETEFDYLDGLAADVLKSHLS